MKNRFSICCHDSLLVGTQSECDRLSYEHEKHSPEFNVYYHKANNEYFYCLNHKELGQYWQLSLQIEMLFVLKNVKNAVFVKKWQMFLLNCNIVSFFIHKSVAYNFGQVPYQPKFWRVLNSVIDKRNKKFRIEIGKSIPHTEFVLNYGRTRYSFFGLTILY